MLGIYEKVDLNIPDRLEERPASKLESSHFLGEYVVSRYSESSTLYVSSIPARTSYLVRCLPPTAINPYLEIRCIAYSPPCVFSVIGSSAYGLNAETGETARVPQPPPSADVGAVRCLLVSPTYLVGVSLRQLVVWPRAREDGSGEPSSEVHSTEQLSPSTSASKDDSKDERECEEDSNDSSGTALIVSVIELDGEQEECGCGAIGSFSEFSTFMGDHLVVVVNNNSSSNCLFQVWDVAAGSLVGWASTLDSGAMESFITFVCVPAAGKVVGSFHSQICIWDIGRFHSDENSRGGNKKDKQDVRKNVKNGLKQFARPLCIPLEGSVVTTLHADETLIITGDNYGAVRIFDTETGALISTLSFGEGNDNSEDLGAKPLRTLSEMFKFKAVKVLRVGRWVVVAFANGRAALYDIFGREGGEPADVFLPAGVTGNTALGAVEVCNGKVVLAYAGPKSPRTSRARTRPEIVVWTPRPVPDTFEYFAEHPQREMRSASPLRTVFCAMGHALAHCDGGKAELAAHAAKLREAAAKVEALDRVRPRPPFCFAQDAAAALDFYDIYLGKITLYKTKVAKNAPLLAEAARKFYISLDLIGSVLADASTASDGVVVDMAYATPDTARTAPPLGIGPAAVFSFRRRALLAESGVSLTLADTDPRVCVMLSDVNATLAEFQKTFVAAVEAFDNACNAPLAERDLSSPKKVDALISIYTKLHALNEDSKEAGKEVGDLLGEKQKGKWYEGGGVYREPDPTLFPDGPGNY